MQSYRVRILKGSPLAQDTIDRIKTLCPGASVDSADALGVVVTVPLHGVTAMSDMLVYKKVNHCWDGTDRDIPETYALSLDEDSAAATGRAVLATLVDAGLRAPQVQEFTDYQCAGFYRASMCLSHHLHHACGAGKTRVAVAWGLDEAGPARCLVVTRVAAVKQWAQEITQVSTAVSYQWKPASRRRKKDREIEPFLVEAGSSSSFFIVGWENLQDAMRDIKRYRPLAVVFDEIHKGASHKRWAAVEKDDGSVGFKKRDNMTAAAMTVSRMVSRRLGLTATPVPDRVRGLWAQLDLVHPGTWGKFYDWAVRYAAAHPGSFGGIDTSGSSNLVELNGRLDYVAHAVTQAELAVQLPPKRRQRVYLAAEDLALELGAWKRELALAAKAGGDAELEVRLAMTASRKRKWVVETVVDAMMSDQKVVVFTGRRKDAEALGEAVAKASAGRWPSWWTHGETDGDERFDICQDYMGHVGGCALIATGDSIGESMNLQDTDRLIVVMLPWTPRQVIQWEGRVARLGQRRPVLIQYAIAEGTVDERVAWALVEKLPVAGALGGDADADAVADELKGLGTEEEQESRLRGIIDGMADSEWEIEED